MRLGNRIVEQQCAIDSSLSILDPLWSSAVTIIGLQIVTIRQQCVGKGKLWILLDGSSKMVDRFFETVPGSRIPKMKTHQIFVVGFGICCVTFCQLLPFVGAQIKRKRLGYAVGDRVLNTKDVSKCLVEFLRPDSAAGRDVR